MASRSFIGQLEIATYARGREGVPLTSAHAQTRDNHVSFKLIMMSARVQCSIKSERDGVNIEKSFEIRTDHEGGYLADLSSQLRQLQSDVNASLSELVDKEKSRDTNTKRAGMHNDVPTSSSISVKLSTY